MKTIGIVVSIFLISSVLLGCASSFILEQGTHTVVRYQQLDKNTKQISLELMLVEEGHNDYENLYSKKRANANIKKAPTEKMKMLLEALEDLDFLDLATPLLSGEAPRYGQASKAILVENEGGQWLLLNTCDDRALNSCDHRVVFGSMVQLFCNCYDSILSLQVIDNQDGGEIFTGEQDRLKEQKRLKEEFLKRSKQ